MHLDQANDGTFLFPPYSYADVEDFAQFWLSVPISDGILANIRAGYADRNRQELDLYSTKWAVAYDREHQRDLFKGSASRQAKADADRVEAYDAARKAWSEQNPMVISPPHARAIARAGQMSFYSWMLGEQGSAEIDDATLWIGYTQMTVAEIVATYRLEYLRAHFQDPQVMASELLEDIRIELRKLQ